MEKQQQRIVVHNDPVFHIVIDNFLGKDVNSEIFSYVLSLKDHFKPGRVSVRRLIDKKTRNNLSLMMGRFYRNSYDLEDERGQKASPFAKSPIIRQINKLFNDTFMKDIMDSAAYPILRFRYMNMWEVNLSRYGDDNQFYKWHMDQVHADDRIISLIYYMHKSPKKFRGGELTLTNGLSFRGRLVGQGKEIKIEPKNDRLVVFSSRAVHCVLPTSSSDRFEDGRFSINIWAGKKKAIDRSQVARHIQHNFNLEAKIPCAAPSSPGPRCM